MAPPTGSAATTLPRFSRIELTHREVPGYWEHFGYDIDGTIRT